MIIDGLVQHFLPEFVYKILSSASITNTFKDSWKVPDATVNLTTALDAEILEYMQITK